MQRTKHLALLYNDKAAFVSQVGCNSNLDLLILGNSADSLTSSSGLSSINGLVEDIKDKNEDNKQCPLW